MRLCASVVSILLALLIRCSLTLIPHSVLVTAPKPKRNQQNRETFLTHTHKGRERKKDAIQTHFKLHDHAYEDDFNESLVNVLERPIGALLWKVALPRRSHWLRRGTRKRRGVSHMVCCLSHHEYIRTYVTNTLYVAAVGAIEGKNYRVKKTDADGEQSH